MYLSIAGIYLLCLGTIHNHDWDGGRPDFGLLWSGRHPNLTDLRMSTPDFTKY